jgi:sulfate adenylyltransferase subunit 1
MSRWRWTRYQQNPVTGGLIFIDRLSNVTVGAGMVREAPMAQVAAQAPAFVISAPLSWS